MSLSRIRQLGGQSQSSQPLAQERDLAVFEVFTQRSRGLPHVHAGSLQAPDIDSAVRLAREHYGQDEACTHLWVVAREHLYGSSSEPCPINKAIEHEYRYARNYQGVRTLWKRFRNEQELKEYEKNDLREAY
ncbi:MAG: hypothetical protein HJJLKODD_00543 [Phycisphaerae bacterium]|nr:hypothetical protein [Phycisphaerae bacterium]